LVCGLTRDNRREKDERAHGQNPLNKTKTVPFHKGANKFAEAKRSEGHTREN